MKLIKLLFNYANKLCFFFNFQPSKLVGMPLSLVHLHFQSTWGHSRRAGDLTSPTPLVKKGLLHREG